MNCLVCECKLPQNWIEKFCGIDCLMIEEMLTEEEE